MATSKKGGYIILDFKNEDMIEDANGSTLLRQDMYNKIKRSYGKELRIINMQDAYDNVSREMIVTSTTYYINDIGVTIALHLDGGAVENLIINSNNEAHVKESD